MDWKTYYDTRKITADEAVQYIKSGDRVAIGHAVGEPTALVDAMVANKDHYNNIETVHMVGMGQGAYLQPGMEEHFRHNSLFVGAPERKAVNGGRADFTPMYLSQVPSLFWEGKLPVDVSLITVTPPDHHGYVSLGPSVDYGVSIAKTGKLVIAQVNGCCPRTHGESFLHVSEIDYFVEQNKPLISLNAVETTEVERIIGNHCASLVEDGSTLQLGIGSLPDAVLSCLTSKNDLGIHSEMISDGVMKLMLAGNINNRKKSLHQGKSVVTFLMGSQELYDFVDDNPGIYMAPSNYTNDPYVISQNSKMVSINSCVQVDLMGQICAESVGLRQISGVGGQVDFIRGANLAKDGKAIIAIPSTTKDGKVSKIVPFLDKGAVVTTNRTDAQYIITEYGIADLRGISLRERAERLIGVSHPDFRPELIDEYERRFGQ